MTTGKPKERTIKCIGCGKVVTKRMQKNQKYCSLECWRNSKHPEIRTGVMKKCEWCGKSYYVTKHRVEKSRFCSKECSNNWQARNKIRFVCLVCGKDFFVSKSILSQRTPKYCSIKCRDNDPNYIGYIAGNMAQMDKKGLNKLEKCGNEILDDISVNYQYQALIENKFLVDVLIPEYKIVIQWDGDYWHGYNKDINTVNDRVRKRMLLDKSQDAYMKECGYHILRFWEHEVYKERRKVSDSIKKSIRQIARRL